MVLPIRLALPMDGNTSRHRRKPGNRDSSRRRLRLESLEQRQLLSASDLDLSFSGDGWTTESLTASASESYADFADHVAIGSDGKILIGNFACNGPTSPGGLIRLTPNGNVDPTFGTGGRVLVDDGDPTLCYRDMALQVDGKIVVVGQVDNGHGFNSRHVYDWDISVLRLNANGTLDSTFGTGGVVETSMSNYGNDTPGDFGNKFDQANAVNIQPDGKIVVGAATQVAPGNSGAVLLRYNSDGSLDTTFGDSGKVTLPGDQSSVQESFLQADGKIVAANINFIARLNPDGTLDDGTVTDSTSGDSFGTGGFVITTGAVRKRMRAIQPDGKILLAGTSSNEVNDDIVVYRLNSDGTSDNSFGITGEARIDKGSNERVQDDGRVIDVQSNGSIIIAGHQYNTNYDTLVARLTPEGTPDTTFAPGGAVVQNLSSSGDVFRAVSLQPNGRIVAVGDWTRVISKKSSEVDFLVVRYQGDPISPLQGVVVGPGAGTISSTHAVPLLVEARARWQAAGIDTSATNDIDLRIANLPGTTLALASAKTIWLDDDAAGWGWFIDSTPAEDSEFHRRGDQGEKHHIDLLTVLMHEVGHVMGYEHSRIGVMDDTLDTGRRHAPAPEVRAIAPAVLDSMLDWADWRVPDWSSHQASKFACPLTCSQ